jgi:hypothetical protein
LQPYFLSSSVFQPPGANVTQTGNRTVAITNKSQGTVSVPVVQVAVIALAAGTLTWTFTTPFQSVPVVTATPQGAGAGIMEVSSISNTSVIVSSSSGTDTRLVQLIAVGNPN